MGFQNRLVLGILVPCSTIISNQAPIPKIDFFLVHIVHKPNTRTFWGTLKICLKVETIVVCVSVNNYSSCCVKLMCQIFYTYISCCVFFFQIYIYMMICNFLPCKCKSQCKILMKVLHYPLSLEVMVCKKKREYCTSNFFISDFGFLKQQCKMTKEN
jgi:hypothetical protein